MIRKFSELPYSRPDGERFCSAFSELAKRMDAAETLDEARSIIDEAQKLEAEIDTLQNIASIRPCAGNWNRSTAKSGSKIWRWQKKPSPLRLFP